MLRVTKSVIIIRRFARSYSDVLSPLFDRAAKVWDKVISTNDDLPLWIKGDADYGITDLQMIQAVGEQSEFHSADSRYNNGRMTFALRIGYNSGYNGYQRIRPRKKRLTDTVVVDECMDEEELLTVEKDLHEAMLSMIGRRNKLVAAGRTDSAVSAVSAIVSFNTHVESKSAKRRRQEQQDGLGSAAVIDSDHPKVLTPEYILDQLRNSEAARSGRLTFYDCVRVPRSFQARASATWRRYLYLVPIVDGCDIDVTFLNMALQQVQNRTLPYNSFAHGDNRRVGEGLLDKCHLYRSRALEVSYANEKYICLELVGDRFLRRMVRLLAATVVREARKPTCERNLSIIEDICEKNNRSLCASAFPGRGLCKAGVGYDLQNLALYKNQPKAERDKILNNVREVDS
jgi:tRNA pseudouridine(38-40) synthase